MILKKKTVTLLREVEEFLNISLNTCHFQMEPQFMHELQVPINGLQYWIDENCFFGLWIRQQVGIGAAFRLKQLNTHKMAAINKSESKANMCEQDYNCTVGRTVISFVTSLYIDYE